MPVNTFACSDGHIYLAIVVDAHWATLCEVMGRADLGDAAGFETVRERTANRRTVNDVVARWFAAQPVDDAVRLVGGAGVTIAKVNTLAEALADPHVIERGVLTDAKLEDGSIAPLVSPPVKFGRTPTTIRMAPPALGAHNSELLEELGYDSDRRARLVADGAILTRHRMVNGPDPPPAHPRTRQGDPAARRTHAAFEIEGDAKRTDVVELRGP